VITDEQIRELRAWAQSCPEPPLGHSGSWVVGLCAVALGEHLALLPQHEARRECAEIWNARHAKDGAE
jgi:hypothetical protein